MKLSDHQAAFTVDLCRLIYMAPNILPGHRIRLGYVERSPEEQTALVDAGKSWVENIATAPHVERRAADLILDRREENGNWQYLTETSEYTPLGKQWELMSVFNLWGGRFGDGNHFQRLKKPRAGEQTRELAAHHYPLPANNDW